MKTFRIASLVLVLIALVATGCSKDNPVSPGGSTGNSALLGTWLLNTQDGQDFSEYAGYYTFTSDKITVGSAVANCTTVMSYVVQGNKIITTVISDDCGDDPVGTKDTVSYTVSGNTLTVTMEDGVFVATKGTLSPVAGLWLTQTIDGEPAPQGINQLLQFGHNTFKMTRYENGEEVCNTVFSYSVSGNKLPMTVTGAGCEGLAVGATDQPSYVVSNDILTLKFSDNTTIVAKRQ
jgi:hypothetical protein